MDGQTVRTALGTIQSNPSAEEAWQTLHDEILEGGGDLVAAEALNLLRAAQERHAARGEADAVVRLLDLATRVETAPPQLVELYVEISAVLAEQLFAGARALSVLQRAVELAPDDHVAAERLYELKSKAERYQAQARSYLGEAESGNDDEYRSAMLMRAAEAEVCFAPDPDFPQIIENLERALRLDASNLPASRLLEVIYRRQANWDSLVKVLERTADRAPSHEDRVAAGIRLARLYQHHFDDSERAAAAYDRVLSSDPTQSDAMEYVTAYYSGEERWDELVRAYERPLKSGQVSDESRLGDMFQVAMLHWKKRRQLSDAEIWFEKIRALEPAHEGVLMFYREYKAQLKDDAGLVQVLEDARRTISDEDGRALELDAEIESRQSDQTKAQKAIEKYKADLRKNPEDAQARAQLKTLYKQTQGHNALVELLRQELERTVESDYPARLEILREVAAVYRQYIKSDTALVAVLNQIVHLDGQLDEQDVLEVRELVSLYDKLGRPRDLLAAQKLLAELVPDREEKISLYRQVGRRWLEQFSNAQHAMEAFASLQELAPSDPEAIERLEDLYRKRRAWKELFALYEQQLKAQSGSARVPLLREMAQLAAERLSRVDEAIGLYREVLEIDPTRLDVLDRLEKLAERAKEWEILAEVLEKRLTVMEKDDSQLVVLQKLGTVYGEHLNKQEDANRTWLRVVEVQPGNPRAMRVLRDNFLKDSRFDELELLYISQNDLEGLAEVLSTAADRNKDPEERLDLSFRAARVYENQLVQAARAIRSYERILSINPKEERAIVRLLPLYEEDEKWVRIPPLLDALLELTANVSDKVRMYEQLVTIYITRLGDKKAAYNSAKAAYLLAPDEPRTSELLDSAARAAGEWEDVVLILNERFVALGGIFNTTASEPVISAAVDDGAAKPKRSRRRKRKGGKQASVAPPLAEETTHTSTQAQAPVMSAEARAVALRLARVLGEELGRGEEAIARLQDLATSSPHDHAVLSELEKLLRQDSRPDDMRWLLNHRQKHASDQAERSAILTEWAVYEETALGAAADALQHFSEAVEAQPDNTGALESVARLSLALNRPEDAVKAISAHRDLLGGYERAQKDALLAELLIERLHRPLEALDAARRALDGGAESGAVIPVLRQLVEVPEVRADAARMLSEQYEAGGESRLEADAVRALITETSNIDERIELYKKLADIYEEKLKEPGAALTMVLEALSDHPSVIDLWDRAGPLAGQAGRPTDLADAYRTALRGNLDDELALDLARRAAELHEAVLNDAQGATPYLEKVLSFVPDDSFSFNRLKEILTAGERWRELEKLYDTEIERLDSDDRKIEMLAEMAMLAEDIIGDAQRAIGFHQRILELDPENAVSLDGMDRLLTRLEKKEELLPLLERRAELSSGEEQHRYLVRAARIALTLLRPDLAIGGIERVLEDDRGNYEARDIAEELIQIERVRVRAALALEMVYESKDEFRDLVRVLGVRVDALRPRGSEELEEKVVQEREDERRDLLRRIATLRDDRLHDDVGSFDVFAELSPLDPADSDLRGRLVDSGRRLGRSEKVVEVLLVAARAASEPMLKAEILLQAATVQADTLDDQAGAEVTYSRVISLKDDEPEQALSAARAIESMLAGSQRHEDLVVNLTTQIELEQDPEHKADLIARLAHLQGDVLGQTAEALKTWEMRIADDPDDAEALRNLTELYEKESRFSDVARVLGQRRDASTDAKERISLARSLADVQERHLGELSAAIDTYQSILDEGGPTRDVLSSLERLYEKAERWPELGEVLLRLTETVNDEVERLRALSALGDLRVQKLEDLPGALDVYRRALSIDISHQESREALAQLLENDDNDTKLEAAEILHPIYEADGNHARLLHVLRAQATATDDPQYRMERYRLAMTIAEDSLHDQSQALKFALLGIVEAAPLGEVRSWLDAVERLAEATQARAAQVEVLKRVVAEIFDPEEQLTIQRRIAELLRSELGDPQGAIAAYQKALEIVVDDRQSLSALETLHAQLKDHPALLEVLSRRIDLADSDAERREISFRRADLLNNTLKDVDAAIAAYEGILDLDLDLRAISQLETLYLRSDRFEDLVALIERRIDDGSGEAADLRVQMATILAEKQGETERGLDELEKALADDPQNQHALALLERLKDQLSDITLRARAAALLEPIYMVKADYDNVLNVLLLRLEAAVDSDERRDLVSRLAQTYEEQKDDYVSALEVTALLLKDDPSDELTLSEMERYAKVAGAEIRLAELLLALLSTIETEDETSARLSRRAGDIFVSIGKYEIALGLFHRALDFEPENHELFSSVDGILQKIGTAQARVELYRATLEHRFDANEKQSLLAVIADLQERELGDIEAAIAAHREAIEADQHNQTSLDALTRLFQQSESWTELADLYLMRAEASGPTDGAMYRVALADLYMRRLGQHEPALDQLEEVVRDQPNFAPAIERLEAMRKSESLLGRVVEILKPIYEANDDWRHLISLNEDRFLLADDPMDQAAVLRETAELWEQKGSDLVRARRVLVEAYRLQPEDEELRSELERLTVIVQTWHELVELYSDVLAEHPELPSKREIVTRIALLCDDKIDDPRQALTRYAELHEMEPSELEPVEHILNLSLLLGDWRSREGALVAKAELTYDEQERFFVFTQLGELRERTLGNANGAIEAYERAFEVDEHSAEVCDRLIGLYEAKGEAQRLAELYLSRAEGGRADLDQQFSLFERAAQLLEKELNEPRRAIECLSRALLVRPSDAKAIAELNRLYQSEEMWPELLDNLRLEAGTAGSAAERILIRRQIGNILTEKVHAYDEALEAFGVILDEKPDDEMALDAVFHLAELDDHLSRVAADLLVPALRQTNLRARLALALRLRLRDEHEPIARVETLRSIAQVHEEDLGEPDAAMNALLDAVAEAPDAEDLFRDIDRLAELTGDFKRYVQVVKERAAEVFDSELAGRLWVRVAVISEEKLGDVVEAISAYQAATEQTGDRPELLDALDRLYTRLDDTEAVVALLDRRMSLAETDQDQSRLLCRQGQLQLDKQKAPSEAFSSLRQALALDLHNQEASKLMFRLLDNQKHFDEAFEVLDGVFRDRPSAIDLAALHQLRVARATSASERIEMRRGLAQVLEDECGDPLAAQHVVQASVADDPSDEGLRDELERLLGVTGAWADGALALLSVLDTKDVAVGVGVHIAQRAAEWLRDRAGEPFAAEGALKVALKYQPDNDDLLEQLEGLQSADGREESLLETLRARATVAQDEGSKIEFLRRCCSLAEFLMRPAVAEQALRDILEIDDQDRDALIGLTAARRAAKDHEEAYSLLERRIDIETDPVQLRLLKFDMAELGRLHLKKQAEAIVLLEELLVDDSQDVQVITALQAAYRDAGRYDDLSRLINTQLDQATEPGVISALKVGLAQLRRDQFQDPQGAITLLEEVFSAAPENQEASKLLAEIYEADGQYSELVGLYSRLRNQAVRLNDQPRNLEMLRAIAQISETKLDDLQQAISCVSEMRVIEDSTKNREEMLRLLLGAGQKEAAAALLTQICDSSDTAQALVRRRELMELYRSMGDTNGLIRIMEGSVALAPNDNEQRASLRAEYEQVGMWAKVAELVVEDAEATLAPTTKLELYRQAADILVRRQQDAASAVGILEKAAQLAPENREVLLELCDAYSESGRGVEAVQVLEQIVESYGGKRSKDLGEIHRRLATAYLSNNEQEKAQVELDKAFRIEPGNINVLKQLGEVAIKTGDMKKAQQMFRALLLQRLDDKSPISKAEVFCRLGQIHQNMGEGPKARQMYERALQTDPQLTEAKVGMESL